MKFARLMAAKAVGSRYLRAVTLRGDRPDEALEVGRLVGEQALCRDEGSGRTGGARGNLADHRDW
jgi:hypothetical protein